MDVQPATVLVVDDYVDNRDLLARRLRREGHRVLMAEDGQEALDVMRQQLPDIVLLDIMMPRMNGYQLLEVMRDDEVLRHLPVIVISALDELDSVLRCIELGAEDYLGKPFNSVLLQARIGAILEKKRLRDQERAYTGELEFLQRIDRELNASLDLERAMALTLEWAMRRSRAQTGWAGLVEGEGIRLMATVGQVGEGDRDWLGLPGVREAINSCGLPHLNCGPRLFDGGPPSEGWQIVAPICRESATLGVVWLAGDDAEGRSPDVLGFLTRLGDHAAIAIANAQLYEAVQAATEAKNTALRFVVHELRNPLTAIRGYTDLLLRAGARMPVESLVSSLRIVAEGAERINTLAADLADVSLIESGRVNLRLDAVSVAQAVDEVARAMREPMATKGQRLEVQIPEELPSVRADRARLVQVLANLVSNAHKYTLQEGTIRVWARMPDAAERGAGMVRLAVQDSGIGIRAPDRPRIFEQFYRTRYLESQDVPGTGLGLHITRQLVEMQGGEIWFESEYQQGSTFYVTLPVAD